VIEFRTVTKRFGTKLAVRNLSFSCDEKEYLVVFGPAGAGKSTTLRLVAGIAAPTYGDILFNGQSLDGVPPERRNFSMAFENYALYSHLTVFENLAFPLRARRLPEIEITRLVREMGELLHIGELLDRKPGFLSGGQRQRVALGRCLIRPADIYLLDEPISHLDARLRIQMRAELKNICLRRASTVIHVTHDYREAMALADRVIVLDKGRLMQDATPETVYNEPANEFVARFVGDPPMSFMAASRISEDGKPRFRIHEVGTVIDFDGAPGQAPEASNDLKIGVRAAEIELFPTGASVGGVPVLVHIVECQGHRNLVTVAVGKDLVQVATPPGRNWTVGETAMLRIPEIAVHLFSDGKAVHHPARRGDCTPAS
jgi:multiple sugar transport system ATP-binding protein